jgi:hypothetical protein
MTVIFFLQVTAAHEKERQSASPNRGFFIFVATIQ